MLFTENYQFRKPIIGVDIADVKDLNFNSDKLDALLHNTQISLAPAYDLNETYDTGDVVMYETLMYKCKADNTTGAWDASKWERTTAGEEGSGGGGTSVVPNPQGTPTETLNTIGIDGTIFDIAGSGGGGTGEGSFYKETTLWSGSDSATMTLSESFENYDAVMLVGKNTYNNVNYSISGMWLTSYLKTHINDGMRFGLANDSWYVYFSITDNTTFVRQDQYSVYISEIKGLKFGGGKAARIDLLWDYVNDNSGNIYWSGNALTLNGDIRNYDEVVVEIVSAQVDLSNEWKSSYQYRLLVDPLINSFESGTFVICTYDQRSVKFQFTNTTLQKLLGNASENGVIRVYGVTYGGAGNSGGGLERTLLYTTGSYTTGSPYQQDVPLLDNLSKYDFISVETGTITDNSSGGAKIDVAWFDVSEILQNDVLAHWSGYSTRWWQAVFTDTTFNMTTRGSESDSYLHEIFKIFGYKISSGSGGGGYSETSLYTYTGSTRQTTLSLSDAYTNYDAIEFTFGWNLGGSDFETVDVISSSKIVSNVFVNVGGEGRYNYISRGSADDEIILATATGSWDGSSIIREVRGINY